MENKFRAWDEKHNRMIADVAVKDGKVVLPLQTSGSNSWDADFEIFDVIPMQSTGFYSSDGRKIYQGDLVEVTNHSVSADIFIGEIKFQKGQWQVVNDLGGLPLFNFIDTGDKIEIIGNFYDKSENWYFIKMSKSIVDPQIKIDSIQKLTKENKP